MMRNRVKNIINRITVLFFSLIVFAFTACEIVWFGDLQTELENDSSSLFRFYAQRPDENPDAQWVELKFPVSRVVSATQFPNDKINIIKPGYHIDYWRFYRDPNTEETVPPSNIIFDEIKKDKVSSINITPQYFDFYAVWAPNTDTKYTVQHYLQNTSLDDYDLDEARTQTLTGTTDEETAASALLITGFTPKPFEQVNINGDETGVVKIYYDRNPASVTVDYSNGTEPETYNGYYGQTVVEAVIPDRTDQGYNFDYWNISREDGTTDVSTETVLIYAEQKETYKAVWKEIVYTITWNITPADGVGPGLWINGYYPTQTYTVSTGCLLPQDINVARRGYSFDGWYTDAAYTTPADSWTSGQVGDKTFYAKWTADEYSIDYVTNHGTLNSTEPSVYTIEDNVTLAGVTRNGWIFNGWYEESDFTGSPVASWKSGDRIANVVVYAKWTEKQSQLGPVTITYPAENDADLQLHVNYDNTLEKWTYSAASGYSSYKWYYDGNEIATWTAAADTSVSLGTPLTAGYHQILVVVKDSSGNEYSAAAIVQVVK